MAARGWQDRLKGWLTPPVFDEPPRTRGARFSYLIQAVLIALNLMNMLAVLIFAPQNAPGLTTNLAVLAGQLGLMALTRVGYVSAVNITLVLMTWVAVTAGTLPYGEGVLDPNYNGYLVVLVLTGILLAAPWSAVIIVLTVGVTLATGSVDTAEERGALATFAAIMIATGLMLSVARMLIRETLNQFDRHQAVLRASEERYRLLLELLPSAITVVDLDSKRLRFVNSVGARMLGSDDPASLIGMEARTLLGADQNSVYERRLTSAQPGVPLPPIEYRFPLPDGGTLLAEARSITIAPDGTGDKPTLLTVFTDITERERLRQEQLGAEQTRIALEQERRLVEMKDNFVTMVSHHFRTPLTVMSTSRELLERYADRLSDERRAEHLRKIGSQIDHMTEMLNDILTLSQGSAGMLAFNPEMAYLPGLMEEWMQVYRRTYPNHHFTLERVGDWRPAWLDVRLLHGSLTHVVANAVKYSPSGSTIRFRLYRQGSSLCIDITDEGIGIPLEEQAHLFQPFYRASNAMPYLGSGLGLALARSGIEAHGGRIQVESAEGSGTTFTIVLPVEQGARVSPSMIS
jgi:PAS domain S-box-containing protein